MDRFRSALESPLALATTGVLMGIAIVFLGARSSDTGPRPWIVPAIVFVVAFPILSWIQVRGVRQGSDDESYRDRRIAWKWHAPVESTAVDAAFLGLTVGIFASAAYGHTGLAVVRNVLAIAAVSAVAIILARPSLPTRYSGNDRALTTRR